MSFFSSYIKRYNKDLKYKTKVKLLYYSSKICNFYMNVVA